MTIKCKNGNSVVTWYDRQSRSWITQIIDPDGNQIGEADYSGRREGSNSAVVIAMKSNGGKIQA